MSKRVHALAKETGLSSKEIIAKLKKLNVEVKGHMSAVEDDAVKKLLSSLKVKEAKPKAKAKAKPKEAAKEKTIKKTKAKEKKVLDKEKQAVRETGIKIRRIISDLVYVGKKKHLEDTKDMQDVEKLGQEIDEVEVKLIASRIKEV